MSLKITTPYRGSSWIQPRTTVGPVFRTTSKYWHNYTLPRQLSSSLVSHPHFPPSSVVWSGKEDFFPQKKTLASIQWSNPSPQHPPSPAILPSRLCLPSACKLFLLSFCPRSFSSKEEEIGSTLKKKGGRKNLPSKSFSPWKTDLW